MNPNPVQAAQAQCDAASAELKDARATLDSAAAAYDAARRRPGGLDYEKARSAWGLALQEWARVLIRREALVDLVAVERRRADRDGADALLVPTRGAR
ncbi:hypothetical protein [Nonomuraea angiospora]|uniref:hypothetical protein n=1 Tax=Nonomuraea angiospora TaxID=46172 RepID=UPI0029AB080E|nr:hypothetical protein [Nonomuraea angiospora]MDX3109698.1 hypothetical protein [Nonomuraea angiospora]